MSLPVSGGGPAGENGLADKMRDFYSSSRPYLDGILRTHGREFFSLFHSRVREFVPSGSSVLEIGCGTGASSALLGESGYRMTGTDVSEMFLDRSHESSSVRLQPADVTALPFGDGTFDAVVSHQVIEHVPAVAAALSEMGRVVRPGGVILLMSPNLLSPFIPGSALKSLLGGGKGVEVWGENIGQAAWNTASNLALSLLKSAGLLPHFLLRVPDLSRPGVPDADAVYLSCPQDVARFFRRSGYAVRDGAGRHSRLERMVCRVAPGLSAEICVVATRPGKPA